MLHRRIAASKSGAGAPRSSSARILNIVPTPAEEEGDAPGKGVDGLAATHQSERARLSRQLADHRGHSAAMSLLHKPDHADCPVCLRLASMSRPHTRAVVKRVKPKKPPMSHVVPRDGRPAIYGSAAFPVGSRRGPRPALATPAASPMCTIMDAVEEVTDPATGTSTFRKRKVSLCAGVDAMPVILPSGK